MFIRQLQIGADNPLDTRPGLGIARFDPQHPLVAGQGIAFRRAAVTPCGDVFLGLAQQDRYRIDHGLQPGGIGFSTRIAILIIAFVAVAACIRPTWIIHDCGHCGFGHGTIAVAGVADGKRDEHDHQTRQTQYRTEPPRRRGVFGIRRLHLWHRQQVRRTGLPRRRQGRRVGQLFGTARLAVFQTGGDLAQGTVEGGAILEAILGIFRHAAIDQRLPAGQSFRQGRHRLVDVGIGHREAVFAGKRRMPGQRLVADHAQGVDIRTWVHFPTPGLFRAHVMAGAHRQAGGRDARGQGHGPGNAEVGQAWLVLGIKQDIGRGHVPVHIPAGMGVAQGFGDRSDHLHHFGQFHSALQTRRQVAVFQQLHGKIMRPVRGHADVVNRHHMRVFKRGQHARFLQEALGIDRFGSQGRAEHLERNFTVQHHLASAVNRRHAATTDLADDVVARKVQTLHPDLCPSPAHLQPPIMRQPGL